MTNKPILCFVCLYVCLFYGLKNPNERQMFKLPQDLNEVLIELMSKQEQEGAPTLQCTVVVKVKGARVPRFESLIKSEAMFITEMKLKEEEWHSTTHASLIQPLLGLLTLYQEQLPVSKTKGEAVVHQLLEIQQEHPQQAAELGVLNRCVLFYDALADRKTSDLLFSKCIEEQRQLLPNGEHLDDAEVLYRSGCSLLRKSRMQEALKCLR